MDSSETWKHFIGSYFGTGFKRFVTLIIFPFVSSLCLKFFRDKMPHWHPKYLINCSFLPSCLLYVSLTAHQNSTCSSEPAQNKCCKISFNSMYYLQVTWKYQGLINDGKHKTHLAFIGDSFLKCKINQAFSAFLGNKSQVCPEQRK